MFRDLLRRAGVAEPEWNAVVETATGRYIVDGLWRAARLAVEIDGARWHLNAAAWERDLRRANALQGPRVEDPAVLGPAADVRAGCRHRRRAGRAVSHCRFMIVSASSGVPPESTLMIRNLQGISRRRTAGARRRSRRR